MTDPSAPFVAESLAWIREWLNESAARAEAERVEVERALRQALAKSDERLEKAIREDVAPRIAEARQLLAERVAEAETKERNAREALERAQQILAEANRKREESVGKHLRGQVGPGGRGRPLGAVLGSRLNRAKRFRGRVPHEALYVVGEWAYWVGEGDEHALRGTLTVEDADRHGDDVAAVVVGHEDIGGDACLGVHHKCSMYRSIADARAVADGLFRADPRPRSEKRQLYTHVFTQPQRVAVAATEYCARTWVAYEATEGGLYSWLRERSLDVVRRRDNVWVFDMANGVSVSSWTARLAEVHGQLLAAGYKAERSERKRANAADQEAHGVGFYLPASAFPGNTAPVEAPPPREDG